MSTLDDLRELDRVTGAAPRTDEDLRTGVAGLLWVEVCRLDDLLPERGAAALVDGEQVALFRLLDGSVHAIGNLDPFSGAQVLARGIVGTRDGAPVVASPMYKQHLDLQTGRCLEQPGTRVPVHPVRVVDGTVLLGVDPVPLEELEEPDPTTAAERSDQLDRVHRDG